MHSGENVGKAHTFCGSSRVEPSGGRKMYEYRSVLECCASMHICTLAVCAVLLPVVQYSTSTVFGRCREE